MLRTRSHKASSDALTALPQATPTYTLIRTKTGSQLTGNKPKFAPSPVGIYQSHPCNFTAACSNLPQKSGHHPVPERRLQES